MVLPLSLELTVDSIFCRMLPNSLIRQKFTLGFTLRIQMQICKVAFLMSAQLQMRLQKHCAVK